MKYILSIFVIAVSFLSFCQTDSLNREKIAYMFHEINKSDATHIGEKIRDSLFIKNFNQIIDLIKVQGYPKFSDEKKNKKLNQSVESGTRRTFLHILQTYPELLLNEEIIDIISNEISEQRLDAELLKIVLSAYQYDLDTGNTVTWSKSVENNFYVAIREWDIKLYRINKK